MTEQHVVYTDGTTLSPQEVMMVARQQASVAVSENAWPSIHAARGVVERIVSTGETVYGINTGFGVGSRANLTRGFSSAPSQPRALTCNRSW